MAAGVLSELAIAECVTELRAACRRPIDESALDALLATLRPQFRQILDRPEGRGHWTDHGRHMRDNGRYMGCLADFFGYQADVDTVGTDELMRAFAMVRDACRVGAERPSPPASAGSLMPDR
jgi:hypothetical protein